MNHHVISAVKFTATFLLFFGCTEGDPQTSTSTVPDGFTSTVKAYKLSYSTVKAVLMPLVMVWLPLGVSI